MTSQYVTFEGIAELSRAPSAIPIVIVPDDVLEETFGPVPVAVQHEGRSIAAWAWAERAWDGTKYAKKKPLAPANGIAFALSNETATGLGIADRLHSERCVVTLRVSQPVALWPVMPLVHDLPASTEVQVPADFPRPHGRLVMVRHGVAAWVTVHQRDHVPPGTVMMSAHLRTITGPAQRPNQGTEEAVFYRLASLVEDGRAAESSIRSAWHRPRRLPPVLAGRFGRRDGARVFVTSAFERATRAFLGSEEQSMRVVGAHPEDVHEHAVAISESALSDLGVQSGDRVILGWIGGETEVTVLRDHTPPTIVLQQSGRSNDDGVASIVEHNPRVPGLARGMSSHLAIRVPGTLLNVMGLPAASVVTVRRSTRSVLARYLNSLVIPVASLALAGAALNDPNWILLSLGAATTALLGLSKLRVNRRRATRLTRWSTKNELHGITKSHHALRSRRRRGRRS